MEIKKNWRNLEKKKKKNFLKSVKQWVNEQVIWRLTTVNME